MPPKAVKRVEDLITTAQLHDLLEQLKLFYKDLLEQEESTYKGFVFNKRLDGVLKELCDLTSSVQYTLKDVDELKSVSDTSSIQCKE